MQLSIPHKASQTDAVAKIKKMIADAKTHLADQVSNIQEEWHDNALTFAFTAQGKNISGTLTVLDKVFNLDVKLPLMLRMFEGRIKSMVEEQGKQMLG